MKRLLKRTAQNPAQLARWRLQLHPELARIVAAWPSLAGPIRRAMLALIC